MPTNQSVLSTGFICKVCFQPYPISDLSPSKLKRCDYRCKKCCSNRIMQYMREHPEKAAKYRTYPSFKRTQKKCQKKRMAARRAMLNRLKSRPCMDCKDTFNPWQMDFDHRDGSTKVFDISWSADKGLKTLLAEIQKCDLVCSNCHRQRTYLRSRLAA